MKVTTSPASQASEIKQVADSARRGEAVLSADPAVAHPNSPGDPSGGGDPPADDDPSGGAKTESLEKPTVTTPPDTTDTHKLLPRPTLKRIPSYQ